MGTINVARLAFALLIVLSAVGCTGDRLTDRFADFQWPGSGKDKSEQKPVLTMAGRWMLTSPNRGQCGMNFSGVPRATEGTIAPEGGCPGNFYTSRRWTLEDGNVIIRDHNGEQLAQLSPSNTGLLFDGQATSGERIMLARQ